MITKIEKLLKLDDYDLEAVFTPAMVNMIIISIVFSSTLLQTMKDLVWWHTVVIIVAPLATMAVLIRFIMHLFRGVARTAFEDTLYRKDRLLFPTTSMLLLNDKSISLVLKRRVRNKLKQQYDINLLPLQKERTDVMEARRTSRDAINIIKKKVNTANDDMMRRKLKRYGKFRNFLGGAIICLPICFACWYTSFHITQEVNPFTIAIIGLYLIFSLIDLFVAQSAAIDYAETLIITFDNLENNEKQH